MERRQIEWLRPSTILRVIPVCHGSQSSEAPGQHIWVPRCRFLVCGYFTVAVTLVSYLVPAVFTE